jgi:hypothetical protein
MTQRFAARLLGLGLATLLFSATAAAQAPDTQPDIKIVGVAPVPQVALLVIRSSVRAAADTTLAERALVPAPLADRIAADASRLTTVP